MQISKSTPYGSTNVITYPHPTISHTSEGEVSITLYGNKLTNYVVKINPINLLTVANCCLKSLTRITGQKYKIVLES